MVDFFKQFYGEVINTWYVFLLIPFVSGPVITFLTWLKTRKDVNRETWIRIYMNEVASEYAIYVIIVGLVLYFK
ncbi:hypothetical protein PQC07_gp073 [Aeromonas phage D3]|uniref:Uncharacterized protein n=2 Tax=Ludhianavirus TaxID=3044751 RepID=A0A514TV94_9CAUD|nr:hypothetical protein PQC07_gp073 [Aeromonas phage D3]YP_010668950.1 hypothetical protein PQC08_gp073 [Aeromonas phage D6]QDJ96932.1 hypothetical protein D3_0202 [Aeromonas phage D3]QDJ97361.1 hypothetical protein D6_0202 [Aeromonas phage D6]QEP52238.1 hypothetical protein D9_0031 [Aeromonas phage D9]